MPSTPPFAAVVTDHDQSPAEPEVHRTWRQGVLVLRPQGPVDSSVIERVRTLVRDASTPVVIDLDESILVDRAALDEVVRRRSFVPSPSFDMCLVSKRLSCRRLLGHVGLSATIAVFQSIEDAIQARLHEAAGYGSGWRPSAAARSAGVDPVPAAR